MRQLKTFFSFLIGMPLWMKILIGLLLGVPLGFFLGQCKIWFADVSFVSTFVDGIFEFLDVVTTLFLNLIKMLIPLLIFASMTMGITSIRDSKKLGRVGLKTLFLYILTTLLAVFIGFAIAHIIKPGEGLNLGKYVQGEIQAGEPLYFNNQTLLLNIVPENIVSAFLKSNYVQIIFFAVFLGWSINTCGDRGKHLFKSIRSLVEVLYKMLSVVMKLTPYAVCAMMAGVIGKHGFQILIGLALYLLGIYAGCLFHLLFVVGFLLLRCIGKLNPIHFFKGMKDAAVISFSTASSNATLSTTMHCVEENLGVSKNIAHFVLPLGATVNMDGAALALAFTAVFIAQAHGIVLTVHQHVTVVITATLSAIGAAGIPGAGGTMIPAVLAAARLPLDGVAAIWGINHIREMISTTTNILGDAAVSVVVAKTEKELDVDRYNEKIDQEFEESNV